MIRAVKDSRVRLEWAEKRLAYAQDAAGVWLNNEPSAGFRREDDPDSGWKRWVFRQHKPFPDEVGLLLGEAIVAMRATLDYLVWGLKGHSGGPQVAFPIVKESGDWAGERNRRLKGIDPRWIRSIESLQPFNDPQSEPLLALQAFNNAEKHKALLTVAYAITEGKLRFSFNNPGRWRGARVERWQSDELPQDGKPYLAIRYLMPDGNIVPPSEFTAQGQISASLSAGIPPGVLADEKLPPPTDVVDILPCVRRIAFKLERALWTEA